MDKPQVSLDRVLNRSWERMKAILFRPFSFPLWATLAFCAWLGTNSNSGNFSNFSGYFGDVTPSGEEAVSWDTLDFLLNGDGSFMSRLDAIIPWEMSGSLVVGLIVLFLVICFLLGLIIWWLYSRFSLIFVANLSRGSAEILRPWREFKRQGNSFFWGSLIISLAFTAISFLIAAVGFFPFLSWLKASAAVGGALPFGDGRLAAVITAGLLYFITMIVFFFYFFLIHNLTVPIMYRDGLLFWPAIRRTNHFLLSRFWLCVGFTLMCLVINIGIQFALMAAICLTCCILALPLSIPYLRDIILLPVHVFKRYLGMDFLDALDPGGKLPEADGPSVAEYESFQTGKMPDFLIADNASGRDDAFGRTDGLGEGEGPAESAEDSDADGESGREIGQ